MNKLDANETKLIGEWVTSGTSVVADETCNRIEWLVKDILVEVAVGNWQKLFRDPDDGRFWEMIYPQSELHGGGPPSLINISEDEASSRYKLE